MRFFSTAFIYARNDLVSYVCRAGATQGSNLKGARPGETKMRDRLALLPDDHVRRVLSRHTFLHLETQPMQVHSRKQILTFSQQHRRHG